MLLFFSLLQIVDEFPDPTGPFTSFSTIQSVIITGYIDTLNSDQGLISYSTDLYYHFSCRYPLEYLINNTKIVAWVSLGMWPILWKREFFRTWHACVTVSFLFSSSVSVATSDNNGTFIDALKMGVFNVSASSWSGTFFAVNNKENSHFMFIQDTSYSYQLVVPPSGLDLRTMVYVEVKAVNLTGK